MSDNPTKTLADLYCMASLLAASGCDLGDEREVLRTLEAADIAMADSIMLSDQATEVARVIRADSNKLVLS
jgi:hypothetical protein